MLLKTQLFLFSLLIGLLILVNCATFLAVDAATTRDGFANCSTVNENIYDPELRFYLDPRSMDQFPCPSLVIRNCHFGFIAPFEENVPIVESIVIENVVVEHFVKLITSFWDLIDQANDPTNNIKPSITLRNVTIMGRTDTTFSGEPFYNHALFLFQFLVFNESDALDRNRTRRDNAEFDSMRRFFPEWTYDTYKALNRNFLSSILIENCRVYNNFDTNEKFGRSNIPQTYSGNLRLAGSMIIRNNDFNSTTSAVQLSADSALDGSTVEISSNKILQNDVACSPACNYSYSSKSYGLAVIAMNFHPANRQLAIAISKYRKNPDIVFDPTLLDFYDCSEVSVSVRINNNKITSFVASPVVDPTSLFYSSAFLGRHGSVKIYSNEIFGNHMGVPSSAFQTNPIATFSTIGLHNINESARIEIINNSVAMYRQGLLSGVVIDLTTHVFEELIISKNTLKMVSKGTAAMASVGISFQRANDNLAKVTVVENVALLDFATDRPSPITSTNGDGLVSATIFFKIMYSFTNVGIMVLAWNHATTSLFLAEGCISVCAFSTLAEQVTMTNISLIYIHSNTLKSTGTPQGSFGFVFENRKFQEIRNITVFNNTIDYSNIEIYQAVGAAFAALLVRTRYPAQVEDALAIERLTTQRVALAAVDNAGADLFQLINNTFTCPLPLKDITAIFVMLQFAGSYTISKNVNDADQYAYYKNATERFLHPYNNGGRLVVRNNRARVAPPLTFGTISSFLNPPPLLPVSNPSTTASASVPLTIVSIGSFGDPDASLSSVVIEDNIITSDYGGSLGMLSLMGKIRFGDNNNNNNFLDPCGLTFRRNKMFVKGYGKGSPKVNVLQDVYASGDRSGNYVIGVWAVVERVSIVVSLVGNGTSFPFPSCPLMLEENEAVSEDGFGSFAVFGAVASCSSGQCFNGTVIVRNNKFSASQNPRSSTLSNIVTAGIVLPFGALQSSNFTISGNELNLSSDSSASSSCALVWVRVDPVKSTVDDNNKIQNNKNNQVFASSNSLNVANCGSFSILDTSASGTLVPKSKFENNKINILKSVGDISFLQVPVPALLHSNTIFLSNVISASLVASSTSTTISMIKFMSNPSIKSSSSIFETNLFLFANSINNFCSTSSSSSSLLQSMSASVATSVKNLGLFTLNVSNVNQDFRHPFCNQISSSSTSSSIANFDHLVSFGINISDDGCNFTSDSRVPRQRTRTNTSVDKNKADSRNISPILTGASNALGGVSMVASALVASVVPSMGFGLARQQSMINLLQGMRDGDCSGISEIEVETADSPTQIQIGSSSVARFYVGGAVGNCVITFGIFLLVQVGGHFFMKVTGSSSWNKPFAVFARCHGSMILFILMSLLFAPSLKFGLVVVALNDGEVSVGDKIVAVVFGVVVYGGITAFYTIQLLFLRKRNEAYRKIVNHQQKKSKQTKCGNKLLQLFEYWFEGPGEWMMPRRIATNIGNNKDQKKKRNQTPSSVISEIDRLNFEAATPLLDGFRGHAWYFAAFEFLIQVGLAFAEFLAQVVPAEKSCLAQAVTLIIVLSIHLIASVWLLPFQERFNRLVVPILDLFQLLIISLALYFEGQTPEFVVTLAVAAVSLQSVIALIVLLVSLSPLVKAIFRIYARMKRSMKRTNSRRIVSAGTGSSRFAANLTSFRHALNDDINGVEEDRKTKQSRNNIDEKKTQSKSDRQKNKTNSIDVRISASTPRDRELSSRANSRMNLAPIESRRRKQQHDFHDDGSRSHQSETTSSKSNALSKSNAKSDVIRRRNSDNENNSQTKRTNLQAQKGNRKNRDDDDLNI